MWFAWKCSPDVQAERGGRAIVVLSGDASSAGGATGIWYATASDPGRSRGRVPSGRGRRACGSGSVLGVRAIMLETDEKVLSEYK